MALVRKMAYRLCRGDKIDGSRVTMALINCESGTVFAKLHNGTSQSFACEDRVLLEERRVANPTAVGRRGKVRGGAVNRILPGDTEPA